MDTSSSLPVHKLPGRYNISLSELEVHLNTLRIRLDHEDNLAYVDAGQIQLLDIVYQHVNKGGSISDFIDVPLIA